MLVIWWSAWTRRNSWKAGLLIIAGGTALYTAVIAPSQHKRSIVEQKATGVGVAGSWEPISLWRQASWRDPLHPRSLQFSASEASTISYIGGTVGGIPGSLALDDANRKIVRTSSLKLEVKSPADCAEKIRMLAEQMGGYLMSSEMSNQYGPGGTITIRVPSSRFEEIRIEIKKLAVRIESEKAEANDVTKDYVDKEARLRNLRAEEAQYLAIMKRATTVKDTLEVSSKLSEVRGQIEQQQAEFEVLARQVETVAIIVSLRAEADTQVLGVHWHPLYELKLAARDGLESLANYATTMTAAIFQLPAVIFWLATMIAAAAIGWRITRWVWRRFFASPNPKRPTIEPASTT